MASGDIARFITNLEDRKQRVEVKRKEEIRLNRVERAMGAERHRKMILDFSKARETSRHNTAMEDLATKKNQAAVGKMSIDMVDMMQSQWNIMYKGLLPGAEETPQMLDNRRATGLMMAEMLGQGQSPKTSLDASTLTPMKKPDDVELKTRQTISQLTQLFQGEAVDAQAYSKAVLFAIENEGQLDPSLDIKSAPIDLTDEEFEALPDDIADKVIQENLQKKLGFDVNVGRTGKKFGIPFTGGKRKVTAKKKDKKTKDSEKAKTIRVISPAGIHGTIQSSEWESHKLKGFRKE